DLSRRGFENVYDERLYPSWGARPADKRAWDSPVAGLAPWLEDRYFYPPPFLLLPRAGLALTNCFAAIRAAWFVGQGLVLLAGLVLLMVWIGGRAGLTGALLIPLLLASIPTMINLQYGQFHGMAVLLATTGMVAFHERRPALGGALLSFSSLAKV